MTIKQWIELLQSLSDHYGEFELREFEVVWPHVSVTLLSPEQQDLANTQVLRLPVPSSNEQSAVR